MRLLASITDVDIQKPIEGVGNILSYGGQMMLIGMLTVFSALTIIWIALTVFKYIFEKSNKKEVAARPSEKTDVTPSVGVQSVEDAELVAVIAAAIAAAESESNGAKFRVVSFRRK